MDRVVRSVTVGLMATLFLLVNGAVLPLAASISRPVLAVMYLIQLIFGMPGLRLAIFVRPAPGPLIPIVGMIGNCLFYFAITYVVLTIKSRLSASSA